MSKKKDKPQGDDQELKREVITGRSFAGTNYAATEKEQTRDRLGENSLENEDKAQEQVVEDLADPDIPA